jgi:tripartite-type tricarboxylate transporter receptor subunit TctC
MKFDPARDVTRLALGLLVALLSPLAEAAAADEYPVRPVRIIVPFTAGGGTDVIARIIADRLGSQLDQRFFIENVTGAGGNVGVERVVRAAPDGYTLLIATMGVVSVNPALYKGLTFDASKDLAPVSLAFETGHIVVVNPSVPARSLDELVNLAREKPGQLSYASGGIGTSTHLYGELFKLSAKVDIVHIPYRGNGPGLTDVVGGQVQVMFDQIASAAGHAASGGVRALAVTTDRRVPFLPDIPTVAEAGMPELAGTSWGGIMAPRGTPREIIARLNQALATILNEPETRSRLDAIGASTRTSSPEVFGELIDTELVRWTRVIEAAKLKVD